MHFSTARRQIISLKLNRFLKIKFILNLYLIVFETTHKIDNNVSKLGIFLWSKVIKTIWICRKLLEESKPYNEMDILKTFVKQRIKMEHFVASENDGKGETSKVIGATKASLQLARMPSS